MDGIYVYADSIDPTGKGIPIKKPVGKEFPYHMIEHTFLGVGTRDLSIVFEPLNRDSFLLYSVGENKIDEHGQGDDVPYQTNGG